MIKYKNIHKSFGKLEVLKGVNLSVPKEGITAVLGPNGSGKTTLIKMLLGMVYPNKGEIFLKDMPIEKNWEYRREINYLPQIARFPENLTATELIALIKDIRGQVSFEKELIEYFDLEEHLDKKIKHLSGGTRQKVNVVLTFMFDNPVIILDEPSSGLDPVALVNLKEMILKEKERGKCILITTHIMSLVEDLADEIVFLLEGKIYFQGTIQELNNFTEEISLEKSIAKLLREKNVKNIKV